MKKPEKRYSVIGTFENPLSEKNPSELSSNLKKLNTNIMNYIKLKGIKYHNISSSTQDSIEDKEKLGNIHTIKEEDIFKKDDYNKFASMGKLLKLEKNPIGRNYRSNSQKSYKRNILTKLLLTHDIKEIKKYNLNEEKDDLNINTSNIILNENIIDKRKSKSVDYVIEKNHRKKNLMNLENEIELEFKKKSKTKKTKRRSVIGIPKENDDNKSKNKGKMQTLFRRVYRQLKFNQIHLEKLTKFCDILNIYKLKFIEDKKQFIEKLKKIYEIPLIYNLRKNLNYHKPIIKQKRKTNSSTSLNNISIYFLPSEIDDDLLSLPNYYTSKDLDIFSDKFFYDIEISKENSFYYKGKKYQRQNSDEIIKYKRLYEMAQESLSKYRKEIKTFNFLSIRIKNINLNFPPSKPSSFKEIEYENLDNNNFTIHSIKKELNIQTLINNFEILGYKKNPYLWMQLPFVIKKIVKKYIYISNSQYFINYLKTVYLQRKKEEILSKILKRKDLRIKRKFFKEYEFKIRLIKYVEGKEREKISICKPNKEISFEIEKDIYDISFLSDSNAELKNLNNSFLTSKSVNYEKSNFKLDYIPKKRKAKLKIEKSNSRIHIMKNLLRKERKRNRKLNYIDKKDLRNSQIMNMGKKYKPVKFIKKVYDNVTGNIIKRHLRQPSDLISNNSIEKEFLLTDEDIKAEEILNEDKYSKMKRVLQFNRLNHFFKFWKSLIPEKNQKPKFFDIIVILMKCLFTDNDYVKAAFMGEIYFIKGKYLFNWYFKVFRDRKKRIRFKKKGK